jgi:hypothetical protein
MPAPTAPLRSDLLVGIGKVTRSDGATNLIMQDESEFSIQLLESLSPISIGGQVIDQRWIEYKAQLQFNTDGRLSAAALAQFWNNVANYLPGKSMAGQAAAPQTDVSTVVTGSDGETHTLHNSIITGLPSLRLHPERGAMGPATITGIIGETKNWTDASAFYSVGSGGTYTDATWVTSDPLRQQYSAAYGAIGGLTDFQMQDGWTIDFNLRTHMLPVQGITRDIKFVGLEVMARGIPAKPTVAQLLAELQVPAASAGLTGRSLYSGAQSLVITGANGTAHVTIPKARLYTGRFTFSGQALRTGEIAFYACRNYSSGAQQALYTIA